MINKNVTEELLIAAIHSDKKVEKYLRKEIENEEVLYEILSIVEQGSSQDARMEGAYWISQSKKEWLVKVEDRLLALMECELDSIVVHIMMALSKIKSNKALRIIIEQRIGEELYWEAEALKNYFYN